MGDFNDMISTYDKSDGVVQPEWLIRGFGYVVVECGLYDLTVTGNLYTWRRKEGNHIVME